MANAATLDLDRLARDLTRAADNAPRAMDQFLAEQAQFILIAMQKYVPVDTGNLKSKLTIQFAPGRITIGPVGVPYSSYVEFGTGTRGEFPTAMYVIKPKTPGGVLAFSSGGKQAFAREVKHPGIRPKPYVRPAAQEYLDNLGAGAAQVGVDLIMGKTRA